MGAWASCYRSRRKRTGGYSCCRMRSMYIYHIPQDSTPRPTGQYQCAHTTYRGTQPQGLQVSINVHIPVFMLYGCNDQRQILFRVCFLLSVNTTLYVSTLRSSRQVHIEQKQLQNVHRNILDGDLLWRFLYLSSSERSELAKRIGTSNDQVRAVCFTQVTDPVFSGEGGFKEGMQTYYFGNFSLETASN